MKQREYRHSLLVSQLVTFDHIRVARVFFDGHDLAIGNQQRIAQAIECSLMAR
jgi:hypothetical protein